MTEQQIRFRLELEKWSPPDKCVSDLTEAEVCRLYEGEPRMIIDREGLEILMRFAPNQEAVEALKMMFPKS
jgi:hypothetical protein